MLLYWKAEGTLSWLLGFFPLRSLFVRLLPNTLKLHAKSIALSCSETVVIVGKQLIHFLRKQRVTIEMFPFRYG